jgi:hypothetical protein
MWSRHLEILEVKMKRIVIPIVLMGALETSFAAGSAQTVVANSKTLIGSSKSRVGSSGHANHAKQKNAALNHTQPMTVRSAKPYPIGFDHRFPRISGFTFPRR